MHLFYNKNISKPFHTLSEEESNHCVRVLRLDSGSEIYLTDGSGAMYVCRVTKADAKACEVEIVRSLTGYGARPYFLEMAVAPTKNMERFEWFVEKATELGVDRIVPVICDHSERKVCKTDRAERIAVAALKQCKRAQLPEIAQPVSLRTYLASSADDVTDGTLSFHAIACCWVDVPRSSLPACVEALAQKAASTLLGDTATAATVALAQPEQRATLAQPEQRATLAQPEQRATLAQPEQRATLAQPEQPAPLAQPEQPATLAQPEQRATLAQPEQPATLLPSLSSPQPPRPVLTILIGPEGDFSTEEVDEALRMGYVAVDLGSSILRTETAAVAAVCCVQQAFMKG